MMSDKCAPALDVYVEEQDSFGNFDEDSVQKLLSLALADPEHAKERFPAYRLTRLVTARFDMDDTEACIFANLARPLATVRLLHDTAPFNDHLRDAIERFGLTSLFCDNGPGRYHHAIRPTGYDYHADAVDAWGMDRWRADYRAMTAAQQMLAASIIWLYRGGKDNRWLRRVPCTWHAADAIDEMRRRDVLADWGRLISLYPGW
jgi:hypothetical protein